MTNTKRSVLIVDRPCGSGKTTQMINTFQSDKHYLVVTPLLSECDRIVSNARIPFKQPEVIQSDPDIESKKDHLIQLLEAGNNVVTTHAMFNNLAEIASDGYLDEYEVVIDEVLSVVDDTLNVKKKSWQEFYVETGYVIIDPITNKVTPTTKWEDGVDDVDDALSKRIFNAAKAGRLFNIQDGNNIAVMPEVLLKAGKSLTVYTFKAEGSIMFAYLERLGLNPKHDKGEPDEEQLFVREVRDKITVKPIPKLAEYKFSYRGQNHLHSAILNQEVPKALSSLKRNGLANIPLERTMITCPKGKWYQMGKEPTKDINGIEITPFKAGPYAKGSRMWSNSGEKQRAQWVPNTTRGTNDYRHCTHAIYLYDQFINPNVLNWFGGKSNISEEDYALTELIQWLWRTQIRDGDPITVYIPSKRMRDLLLDWLWEGNIPTQVQKTMALRC